MTATTASDGMSPEEFREYGHRLIDWAADYLSDPRRFPVLPDVAPGDVRAALPTHAPEEPEAMDDILRDFERIVFPGLTLWNHPRFLAYFSITGSAPGILGELIAATLNVNAMLWATSPAATELEEVATGWLRDAIGLPATFEGVINDTASSSTLYALAAAREYAHDLRIREEGLAGRSDVPRLRIYCSEEAHSSVDKAALTLGLGRAGIRHIPADDRFRMDVSALDAAVRQDLADGVRPIAVVGTVGTTSTTSVDPIAEIADVCDEHDIWLHVDAAYAGPAAMLDEKKWILNGCDRAHSLVTNPHKWLFTPADCSVLYTRLPEVLKQAFSLVPEYLTTTTEARNLMDYGNALGRRFRAIKLWFVLRRFGLEGIRRALREHIRIAERVEEWIRAEPDFEVLAPREFSVVAFRYRPAGLDEESVDRLNAALLRRINEDRTFYLSHTRLKGQYAIRIAIGNLMTREDDLAELWSRLKTTARSLGLGDLE